MRRAGGEKGRREVKVKGGVDGTREGEWEEKVGKERNRGGGKGEGGEGKEERRKGGDEEGRKGG